MQTISYSDVPCSWWIQAHVFNKLSFSEINCRKNYYRDLCCAAIWEELSIVYLRPLKSYNWKIIAEGYKHLCGFPNCIGAIDGKHINIVCPANSGTQFFNYKKRYSIVILAVCDANKVFTIVDIGA